MNILQIYTKVKTLFTSVSDLPFGVKGLYTANLVMEYLARSVAEVKDTK